MSHDATLEMFFEEAADLVRDCEAALLRLEQASSEPDPGLVNRIFRNVHTLKGSSAMLGFDRLAGVAHALEDVLVRMRKGEQAITPLLVDTLLASVDVLRRLLERARQGSAGEPEDLEATLTTLRALTVGAAAHVGGNGSVTIPAGGAGLFGPTPDEGEGQDPDRSAEATTVRVSIEKVDSLVNLVGEIVITQSMIDRLVADLAPDRVAQLEQAVAQMDRHAREPHGVQPVPAPRARSGARAGQAGGARNLGRRHGGGQGGDRTDRRSPDPPASQRHRSWHRDAGSASPRGQARGRLSAPAGVSRGWQHPPRGRRRRSGARPRADRAEGCAGRAPDGGRARDRRRDFWSYLPAGLLNRRDGQPGLGPRGRPGRRPP